MTLTTSSAGMQLPMRADVKVRGVIVGQVNKAESEGEGATLTLGIKPDKIGQIPRQRDRGARAQDPLR